MTLQPDEKKTIPLEVKTEDLAFYNTEIKSWEIERMRYEVLIGKTSRDDDLMRGEFTLV